MLKHKFTCSCYSFVILANLFGIMDSVSMCVLACVRLLLNLASANCNYRATSPDALEVIPDQVHLGERRLQGCVVSYKIATADFGKRTEDRLVR